MYEITRKARLQEKLVLKNTDGTTAHTLNVDINVDEFAGRWNKARATLSEAQEMLQAHDSEKSLVAYGNAVIGLMQLIFGEDQAATLLTFYENRYTEMLLDVFPFINDCIAPKINETSKARLEQINRAVKRSGKRI